MSSTEDRTATPPKRSRTGLWLVTALVLLPILYVLSVGPVFCLVMVRAEDGRHEAAWLRSVYAPLTPWLDDHRSLLNRYILWWWSLFS